MDNSSLIISTNVLEIRDALGLSQKDFALLIQISAATLVNIESGKKSFRIKSLDGLIKFTDIKLAELSKKEFIPPNNLREILSKRYKKVTSIYVLLDKEPSIPYCIKYKLLPSKYFKTAKETGEIKNFFFEMGWDFKANSLHTALKRMPDLIKITPHPEKIGTNLYSKK